MMLKSIIVVRSSANPASAAIDSLRSSPPITVPPSDAEAAPPAFPWRVVAPEDPSDESVPCTSEAAKLIGAKLKRTMSVATLVPTVLVTRSIGLFGAYPVVCAIRTV